MSEGYAGARAREDFSRARVRAAVSRLAAFLRREGDRMLSLGEVKALLKPDSETYGGLQTVPIARIVGSEGRYHDFNRAFLPRHGHLRSRWVRVDMAHHQSVELPPVALYEIGGVYFVRDGNHRVSVARMQGVEFVDAEVIRLGTRVELDPGLSAEELRVKVIELEKEEFLRRTGLNRLRPGARLEFTATGRYDELIRHVHGHKYYLNQGQREEIPFEQALLSWYDNVFSPVAGVIREENLLTYFPGRTAGDLYVWLVRHWDVMKRKYGQSFPLREAALDFRDRYGRTLSRLLRGLAERLSSGFRRGKGPRGGRRGGA